MLDTELRVVKVELVDPLSDLVPVVRVTAEHGDDTITATMRWADAPRVGEWLCVQATTAKAKK